MLGIRLSRQAHTVTGSVPLPLVSSPDKCNCRNGYLMVYSKGGVLLSHYGQAVRYKFLPTLAQRAGGFADITAFMHSLAGLEP